MDNDPKPKRLKVPSKTKPHDEAKRDHYVPAVYLKGFGDQPNSRRGGSVSVLPLEGEYIATNKSINDVCFEWDRNTSKHPIDMRWLENEYSVYEGEVGKLLNSLSKSSEITDWSDIISLAQFIAVQFFRSKAWDEAITAAISSHGVVIATQYPDDPVSQEGSLRLFSASGLARKLIDSHWIWIEQGQDGDLLTSDSPVVPLWDKANDIRFPHTLFFNVNRKLSVVITDIGMGRFRNSFIQDVNCILNEALSAMPLLNYDSSMSIGHVSQKDQQYNIVGRSNNSATYRFTAMMTICNEIDQSGMLNTSFIDIFRKTIKEHPSFSIPDDAVMPAGYATFTKVT